MHQLHAEHAGLKAFNSHRMHYALSNKILNMVFKTINDKLLYKNILKLRNYNNKWKSLTTNHISNDWQKSKKNEIFMPTSLIAEQG